MFLKIVAIALSFFSSFGFSSENIKLGPEQHIPEGGAMTCYPCAAWCLIKE